MDPNGVEAPPEYMYLYQKALILRHTDGIGYLDAYIHLCPDLSRSKATGIARRLAAERLCEAVRYHAYHYAMEPAITVLQTALREAMTTLQLEHDAILLFNLPTGGYLRTRAHKLRLCNIL